MTSPNSHIRFGFCAVRPYVHGPLDLPLFVERTFGAVELERYEFGPESIHAAYRIGDSVVIIEAGKLPLDVRPWVGSIYVYVEDVDAVYDQALKLGARSVTRPEDKPYQERSAGFQDAAGNTWWIATYREP
jgi:PhnB protein